MEAYKDNKYTVIGGSVVGASVVGASVVGASVVTASVVGAPVVRAPVDEAPVVGAPIGWKVFVSNQMKVVFKNDYQRYENEKSLRMLKTE